MTKINFNLLKGLKCEQKLNFIGLGFKYASKRNDDLNHYIF